MQFDIYGQPIEEDTGISKQEVVDKKEEPKEEEPKHVFGKLNIPPDVSIKKWEIEIYGY